MINYNDNDNDNDKKLIKQEKNKTGKKNIKIDLFTFKLLNF